MNQVSPLPTLAKELAGTLSHPPQQPKYSVVVTSLLRLNANKLGISNATKNGCFFSFKTQYLWRGFRIWARDLRHPNLRTLAESMPAAFSAHGRFIT
jgi:hypothetical protein